MRGLLMQITDTIKESQRKKVMYKDYSVGKRIWEMEQCFNDAVKNQDHYMAEHYNREIDKLYRQVGIRETDNMHKVR